ncbi:Maleylacetate reductase [Pseudomonas fluorescens]|uniref:maleylacetate reductase n=1 Tax=Pseudomonas fluorescens TaxID=294 RepID=UPI00123F944F|nr:maleylacetate reductase [Pseudomonas fluorescens]VVM37282.1 Maleylacetate reductase [Pseudomonas fluorescens]VVP99514.1 Maleylacetate reductase [Pseudomonas fluorescens]
MQPFVFNALPGRVIFGSGTLSQVGDEIRGLGCGRALLLSTPEQKMEVEKLAGQLGDLAVGIYANATMHTPTDVTLQALQMFRQTKADCVVALGGGSTIGLAKAIALHTDAPQIVIPTTYAGSEATPIIGQTENGIKTTQKTLKVLPEVIVYDVDLTLGLPAQMSVTSGLNAIAHAVEALYAKDANPLISMLAEQGIAAIARALPRIIKNPDDREARSDALYGAWACGVCLGAVGMSIHHKLCHTLGGSFSLPHAQTHTAVLPHAAAYNFDAAPEAMVRIAAALGVDYAPRGLFDLAKSLGAPTSLAEIGLEQADLAKATDIACASPYWNPRTIEPNAIAELLANAWAGNRP